jgi:hypothetical protein
LPLDAIEAAALPKGTSHHGGRQREEGPL